MCGIAGIFDFATVPSEDAVLARMGNTLAHRGPDSHGFYRSPDRRVGLAHRRLSIVDLSEAGRQPMSNEDGTVWITFNGEIYNHEIHRQPLESRGHRFRSRADTEAIIHLYEEYGTECVSRLDGMFAFAIWDQPRRRLLLVRDRLGKKPLYYTTANGRFLFASEIKGILAHPDVRRDLDLEALNHFLTFSNTPAPLTLFRGIFKLPPAHTLLCDESGRLKIQRYWSPLDGPSWPSADGVDAVERVRGLLERAVQKRLMSDVPVGAFLSGGIDSSANVALMSRLTSEPLRTFSVGFEGFGADQNFHDLPYARQIAAQFGCSHQEVTITARDCEEAVPQLVYHQDEPIGDPACLPMHFASRAAKAAGVTVVLVGEGSDEVFGGYDDMVRLAGDPIDRWNRLMQLPRGIRKTMYGLAGLAGLGDGRLDVLRRAAANEPFYWGLDIVFNDVEKRRLFRDEWQAPGARPGAYLTSIRDELARGQPDADFLQQMSFIELSNRLPELLLMRVDKFSMAHSLEARAPFLDHELVTYALSLPQHSKINGAHTKHVLKQALAGVLPRNVIERRKQGFRVPLPEWLAGDLSSWAEDRLFSQAARELDFLNFDYIRTLWQRHKSGQADQSFDLWCLINVFSWYECWFA